MFNLLIYMFENYLSSKTQLDFNSITLELEAAGFDNTDIENAVNWFSQLKKMSDKVPLYTNQQLNNKLRVFTKHEKEKIASDGLGFILFLEQARILNSVEREIILDQAMMINQSRINIDEIRWIVMMTLWNNNRENDYLFVENTLYQSKQSELH